MATDFTPEEQAEFEANKVHFRTVMPHQSEDVIEMLAGWKILCGGFAKALGDAKDHLEATTDFNYAEAAFKEE
jgi:hypothetical protein